MAHICLGRMQVGRFYEVVVFINRYHHDVLVVFTSDNQSFIIVVDSVQVIFQVSPKVGVAYCVNIVLLMVLFIVRFFGNGTRGFGVSKLLGCICQWKR